MLASGAGTRIQDFVERLCNQVYVPFLYNIHELDASLLPTKTYKAILTDELEHEYTKANGDILDLRNAKLIFSIGAGARLQARRTMAQAIPIMLSFLQSQNITDGLAIEGKKVDVLEVTRMIFEVSDWRNYSSVIVPMTPQDQQRWQQAQGMNKPQVDFQNKAKLEQMKFENKSNLIDQQNTARAVHEVIRQDLEKSAGMESLEGTPGNAGFGGG